MGQLFIYEEDTFCVFLNKDLFGLTVLKYYQAYSSSTFQQLYAILLS